ncbi:MAG: hypothetical protein H6718_11515 [Polyangiaceae bacterium]|nr:hypothetical protein [Polyangiaceae bacterium]
MAVHKLIKGEPARVPQQRLVRVLDGGLADGRPAPLSSSTPKYLQSALNAKICCSASRGKHLT